jgi:EAL domain-containing protein (putative c-di-GMP-specific phosphodiesterase class I)
LFSLFAHFFNFCFWNIAERVGLINDITKYVIEKSFADLAFWNNNLKLGITLSINVSADNIKDPSTFQHACLELARNDILPSNILLEVTETAIMSNPEESIRLLIMFDGAGIKLSIDDFGTGHSSFIYLKHLPIREIKVDRGSFAMRDCNACGTLICNFWPECIHHIAAKRLFGTVHRIVLYSPMLLACQCFMATGECAARLRCKQRYFACKHCCCDSFCQLPLGCCACLLLKNHCKALRL